MSGSCWPVVMGLCSSRRLLAKNRHQISANDQPTKVAKVRASASAPATTSQNMAVRILMRPESGPSRKFSLGKATLSDTSSGYVEQKTSGNAKNRLSPNRQRCPQRRRRSNCEQQLQLTSGAQRKSKSASGNSNRMLGASTSSDVAASSNQKKEAADEMSDGKGQEPILFTSLGQLCAQIISKDLREKVLEEPNSQVLCLFMFGCQGSSLGELQFELAQHSNLVDYLQARRDDEQTTQQCPLYHLIDAAAVIVTNIDGRIREYNRLRAQTSRSGRHQLASLSSQTGSLDETSMVGEPVGSQNKGERESCSFEGDDRQTVYSETFSQQNLEPNSNANSKRSSSGSTLGSLANQLLSNRLRRLSTKESTTLLTLNTKQRSILQLKLVKYFNSVTSKWLIGLIQREIELLEEEWTRLELLALGKNRPRVYLINLVPNQLSLFKSCLYLEQNLHLKEFRYPYWALKFQRRTNIRVLRKERPSGDGGLATQKQPTSSSQVASKVGHKLMGNMIRLPSLLKKPSPSGWEQQEATRSQSKDKNITKTVASVISNNLNEKLGPKYNENFVTQFRHMKRLMEVRYNPTTKERNCCRIEEEEAAAIAGDNSTSKEINCSSIGNNSNRATSCLSSPSNPSHYSSSGGAMDDTGRHVQFRLASASKLHP